MKGTFIDFMELLNENEALRKDIVEVASKHGFEFNDEISDAELDAVAGGVTADLPYATTNDATANEATASDAMASDATAGDQSYLADIDMQNMLQKQQMTMQLMSQISKVLHDTSSAMRRKMSGLATVPGRLARPLRFRSSRKCYRRSRQAVQADFACPGGAGPLRPAG